MDWGKLGEQHGYVLGTVYRFLREYGLTIALTFLLIWLVLQWKAWLWWMP